MKKAKLYLSPGVRKVSGIIRLPRGKSERDIITDTLIEKYGLKDPALQEMALLVRGADTKMETAPAESAGLAALAAGFRFVAKDDFENMRLQFPAYDAWYAYCKAKVANRN